MGEKLQKPNTHQFGTPETAAAPAAPVKALASLPPPPLQLKSSGPTKEAPEKEELPEKSEEKEAYLHTGSALPPPDGAPNNPGPFSLGAPVQLQKTVLQKKDDPEDAAPAEVDLSLFGKIKPSTGAPFYTGNLTFTKEKEMVGGIEVPLAMPVEVFMNRLTAMDKEHGSEQHAEDFPDGDYEMVNNPGQSNFDENIFYIRNADGKIHGQLRIIPDAGTEKEALTAFQQLKEKLAKGNSAGLKLHRPATVAPPFKDYPIKRPFKGWMEDFTKATERKYAEIKKEYPPENLPENLSTDGRVRVYREDLKKPDENYWYMVTTKGQHGQWVHVVQVFRTKWDAEGESYVSDVIRSLVEKTMLDRKEHRKQEKDQELQDQEKQKQKKKGLPKWAIQLRKQVQAELDQEKAKKANKDAVNFPDLLSIDVQGSQYLLKIWVESVEQPEKDKDAVETDVPWVLWNTGVIPRPLFEGMDIQPLVNSARKLAGILRNKKDFNPNIGEAYDKIVLPPYPAQIHPQNMDPSHRTVVGGQNKFRMALAFDTAYDNTLSLMGKAKNMTVSHFWGMYYLPNAIEKPAYNLKDWPERRAFIQQEVAVSGIDWKKRETGRIATSGEKHKDWEFEFDFKSEGDYVIFCEAQAFVDREFEYVQEPSTAFLIVNVSKAEDIGKEHVNTTPGKIDNLDMQKWMAEQSGDYKRSAELAAEIEKLQKEENMSPAELLQSKMGETRKVLQNVEYIYDLWEQYYRRNIPMMGDKDNGPFNIILQERNKEAYELWLVINQMATSKVSPDHILRQMRDNLRKQLEEYRKLDSRTYLAEKKGNFKEGGKILRPEVTLVATDGWMDDESGKAYSLFMMLGETADSKPEKGEYEYKLIDLTSPTVSMSDVVFEGEGDSPAEAIHEAFAKFGRDSSYPNGKIIYRIPPERETFEVESKIGAKKVLQVSAMVLGMLAMLAGTVATAGALSPGLAAAVGMVAATMGVSSAIIGGTLAMVDIIERVDKDTAEWDADMIMSIIDILGSLVAVADSFVEGLKMARLIKTANGLAKVEKFEKIVMISDIAELSGTTILVGVKVAQDFDVIDKMPISDAEKTALKNQVISSAVQQGAMILLSGAMVANRAIKDKMDSVQSSKYQSFFDKGWVDKNGRITADAPAYMVKNRPHTPEPEAPTSKVTTPAKPTTPPPTVPGVKAPDTPAAKPVSGPGKAAVDSYVDQHHSALAKQPGDPQKLQGLLDQGMPWRDLQMHLLGKGDAHSYSIARNLFKYREKVVEALKAKVDGVQVHAGSTEKVSDVDIFLTGDNAGANLIKAEAEMAKYGPDWSEKFRMNFYTDASRLTKFQEAAGSMNKYQVTHAQQGITEATEIYNFAKMQQHAQGIKNADQRALALDRVKGLMDAAGLDGVSRKKVAELADLNPKQIRERRDAALLAVDQLMKAYNNPNLDSNAKADLALQITHKQMEANFYTVEAYIGPGAAKMTIGKQKVVGQEAYQAALSNLEMMEHAIRESGGDFIAAARNYELFKYIDRYLEAVKTSGMKLDAKMQQRVEFFSNLSVYLTQVHRGAHGADAHLPGSRQKAIDQGADPDRLGDMDTPVTDQHLREQFEDFSDLAKDTLGKLKAHGQQHGGALTGTKVSSAGPPVVFDEFWKEAANFKYIRKHLNQPMPDSPPEALYLHYNVSWQGKQAQVSRRINDDQKFADLYVDQHNILRTAQPKGDAFHFLKQTKDKAGGNLSTKELKAELLFVIKFLKEGKVLRSKTGEYDREVTLPNGHTWKRHRDNGDWCRFSTGDCFTGGRQNRIQHILEEFAEAQQLGYDYPIKVKDKYRQVSEAEALRKLQGQNYPGKGQEHRAKVKESHDLGVEFGRVQADKDDIKILNIDFPDKWLGDFGKGLDDLGTRNGNYIFLEYKGQTADLGEGQMTSEWVGKQIALIEHQGNQDLAQNLLTAALEGRLQGVVYSSAGSPSTGEVHTKRIISGAISKSANVSPSNLISYQHKAVMAGYTTAKAKLAKQLGGK